MTAMTTVKVPVGVRDRLAQVARAHNTTLAGAITLSLRTLEEAAFWQVLDEAMTVDPPTKRLPDVPLVHDLLEPEPEWDE